MGRKQEPRYHVTIWHGEVATIGAVVDRKRDRVMGRTSTYRDGARWRQLLDIQCAALNRAQPRSTALNRAQPR